LRCFAPLGYHGGKRGRYYEATSRAPRLLPEYDPFMLRGILRCGGCGGSMTTSSSRPVTLETVDSVPRYYRCRGSVAYPACRPAVQVSAREVEGAVVAWLRQLQSFRGVPLLARAFLATLVDDWDRLDRHGRNILVQGLVVGVTWHPAERWVTVELDADAACRLAAEEARRRATREAPPPDPRPPRAPARSRRVRNRRRP